MATIDGIGLQEPSTITKSLAAVQIERNSSITFQEVMVIGDPDSTTSSAVAKVTNAAAASTAWGLVTRPVMPTVTVAQSTAGDLNVTVANLSTTMTVRQSSAGDLNVTVANLSTTVNVSSLGGAVIVRSSAAAALVTAYQSTFTDLNANVRISDRDASTATVAVLNSTPPSTSYGLTVRLPAPITDSTNNALRVFQVASSAGAGSTEVTIRQSTFTDLNCRINAPSTANSSNYLPVRITDGSSYITPGSEYTNGSTYSSLTGPALMFDNGTNATMRMVGSTMPLPVQLRTSSGASAMDSTEGALKVNVVAGAAAGSTIVTVSTGSVRVHQSSAADLNVTVAGYSTVVSVSTGSVRVHQSTYTDLQALAGIRDRDASTATAAVLNAAPVSTTYGLVTRDLSTGPFAISSIAGRTLVDQNSTTWPVQVSSVAGVVTVSTGPTLARLVNSSGDLANLSTAAPAVGQHALAVRQGLPALLSTRVVITSSNSTALYSLISSAAGVRHKVFAYSLTSTETTPSTLVFFSSATIDRWAISFGSGSSGVTGANLTVSPPAWLFQTDAANALQCLIEKAGSTQCIVTLSLAYFTEA